MRRVINYAGAVPLETDLLNLNKNVMVAIGHVLQDMIGTSTLFSGLGCVPTSPAGMTVNVNPGRAYSLQATDTGAYSSLTADAHTIVKQGILLDAVNFSCPAPTTAGFSINYLVQGAFQEVDGGSTVLPYYNASNPATAYSGPNNTGTSNTTYRDNTVQLSLKAGTAATTGSQVTPTPDAGFNGLWVITVPFGATSITSGNISQYTGAPFLTNNLLSQIQAVPTAGRLLNVQTFTSSGTYTPTTGASKVWVKAQGAGGGGGGAPTTNASQVGVGIGGNSGAYGEYYGPAVSQTITVGAAGAAGAAGGTAGGNGGASSFGSLLTAAGGVGGNSAGPTSAPVTANNGFGDAGATGGFLSIPGNRAIIAFVASLTVGYSGAGANSQFGRGGTPINASGGGIAGFGYGSGGSGGLTFASQSQVGGGAGGPGIVIVFEFS
jgi:hypothetical protein